MLDVLKHEEKKVKYIGEEQSVTKRFVMTSFDGLKRIEVRG